MKKEIWILLGIWCGVALIHGLWLALDRRPLVWDQAHHFLLSLDLRKALSEPRTWYKVFSLDAKYPPLFHLSLAGLFGLWGPVIRYAALVNLFWLLAVMTAILTLGNRIFSPGAGVLSAAIFALFPISAGLTRELLIEMSLTATVAWTMVLLLESGHFTRRGPVLFLGVMAGLGFLAKWSYGLMIAGPILWTLYKGAKNNIPMDWRGIRWAVFFCLILALPWYLHTPRTLIKIIFSNLWGYGELRGYPPVFSFDGLYTYIDLLINDQLLVGIFLFFLAGLALSFREPKEGVSLLWVWFFFGLVLQTLLRVKDSRLIYPLLPAAALFCAGWTFSLKSRWVKGFFQGVLVLVSLAGFLGTSFRLPWISREVQVSIGPEVFYLSALSAGYSRPPDDSDWAISPILGAVKRDWGGMPRPAKLVVLASLANFHKSAFTVWAKVHGFPVEPISVIEPHKWETGREKDVLLGELALADYLVVKTGFLGEDPNYDKAQAVLTANPSWREGWIKIGQFGLPDQSLAILFKRGV